MKSNLAQEQQSYQAEVVRFPKQERQAMSESKFNYVTGIRAVKMHSTTKHVAITLATYADYETGICYPTVQTLMDDTGLSNRVVCLHLKKLEELGFLISKKVRGCNSKYKFIAENIKKAVTLKTEVVTQSHHFNDGEAVTLNTQAVTLMQEAVTLSTQSSDAESHKLLLTTNNNQEQPVCGHTQEFLNNDWKPEISFLKTLLCQTKFGHQTSEILSMSDFQFHLGNFNSHWENKTPLTENQKHRKFALWLIQEFEKAQNKKLFSEKQTSSRDVNQKWGEVQQYAPATGEVDLEGLI